MNEHDLISRRTFLSGTTAVVALSLMNQEKNPAQAEPPKPQPPPVRVGVIGTGLQGQNLISQMTRIPDIQIAALCDVYPSNLKKGQNAAGPKAPPKSYNDYRQLLNTEKDLDAVFIATPPNTHKEISLAAIQAGKHVYCEAPLAIVIDEAKDIVRAAEASKKVFQVGHHQRSNPLYHHVVRFVRAGMVKDVTMGRAQWNKKQSWRRAVSDPKMQKVLNWKLYNDTSAGLMGEFGSHQLDVLTWYIKKPPVAVTGWGGITVWNDGRETFDTVHCLFEYPNNVTVNYSATITYTHDGIFEQVAGAGGAIVLRDERGWLFKEADADVFGWEVYAGKEMVGDEEGITLVADATKLLAQGLEPGKVKRQKEAGKNSFFYAIEEFVANVREGKKPNCGVREGLQAAVIAIKANEAVRNKTKVTFQPEWFAV